MVEGLFNNNRFTFIIIRGIVIIDNMVDIVMEGTIIKEGIINIRGYFIGEQQMGN